MEDFGLNNNANELVKEDGKIVKIINKFSSEAYTKHYSIGDKVQYILNGNIGTITGFAETTKNGIEVKILGEDGKNYGYGTYYLKK